MCGFLKKLVKSINELIFFLFSFSVSGLRDNTIKMWDRQSLACQRILTGHTGSVLCLQYDERVIISGSSDSTVRVWDVTSGDHITTLIHHCEAVLHLR